MTATGYLNTTQFFCGSHNLITIKKRARATCGNPPACEAWGATSQLMMGR